MDQHTEQSLDTNSPVSDASNGSSTQGTQDQWHRLHPLHIGMSTIRWVRSLIGFIVGSGFISIKYDTIMWLIVGTAICVIGAFVLAIAEWWTTRYSITTEHVILRKGIFNHKEQALAWQQIRSMNAVEPWMIRPFKLVNITIAAKGADADILLPSVPQSVHDQLKRMTMLVARPHHSAVPHHSAESRHNTQSTTHMDTGLNAQQKQLNTHADAHTHSQLNTQFHAQATGQISSQTAVDLAEHQSPVATATEQRAFVISMRDVVLYAVTNINIIAGIAALYALWGWVPENVAVQAQDVVVRYAFHSVISAIFAICAGIIFALVASIVIATLRWMNFSIDIGHDTLTIARGAFSRTTQTITVSRIQGVVITQTLLRRILHVCTVSVIIGSSDSDSEDKNARSGKVMLIPVVHVGQLDAIMHRLLPDWQVQYGNESQLRRTGRGLGRYYVLVPSVIFAICSIATVAIFSYIMATEMLHTNFDDASGLLIVTGIVMLIVTVRLIARIAEQRVAGYEIIDRSTLRYIGIAGLHISQIITHHANLQLCQRQVPLWRVRSSRIGSLGFNLGILTSMQVLYWRALLLEDTDRLMRWFIR